MNSNNKGAGKNLNELLRAGGYEDDGNENNFAGHLGELSLPMLRRVRVLKKYQMESLKVESKFYEEVHLLELKYQPLFNAINEKRKAIVVGDAEVQESEDLPPLLHGIDAEELAKLEREAPVEGGEPSKGIPGFWYRALNSVGQISDTIKEYDEPILKYLIDITTEVHTNPKAGFSLYFHFAENPYFTDSKLTKYYEMDLKVDEQKPFDYDGPNIVKSRGTVINWKEGKNVTQKIVKKKQKKGPQAGKYVTKPVSTESFFNFFDPALKVISELDETEEQKAEEDIEIGQAIRDQIIPRAVLFFTGEAADDDDWDEFGDEEDEEGDEPSGSDDE